MENNNEKKEFDFLDRELITILTDELIKARLWQKEWQILGLSALTILIMSLYIFGFYFSYSFFISFSVIAILIFKLVQRERIQEDKIIHYLKDIKNGK